MISRKAEYAITTLAELATATDGRWLASGALARSRGIPPKLVAQIVAALARQGWVATRRGAGGGVRLAVDPGILTLRQVIEAIDGPSHITRCLVQDGQCSQRETCQLRSIWAEAQAGMLTVLERVTIGGLARAGEPAQAIGTGTS